MDHKFRLLTYSRDGRPTAGVLFENLVYPLSEIVDLGNQAGLLEFLTIDPDFELVRQSLQARAPSGGLSIGGLKLLPPLLYPGALYIAGTNYADHIEEMRKGRSSNDKQWFLKTPWHVPKASRACLVGSGASVRRPAGCQKFDWEVELAVIIGREASSVTVDEAIKYVAGYCVANDLSARDLSRRPDVDPANPFVMDWIQHKSFNGACPLGPWITPRGAVLNPDALDLKLWVNEQLRQNSNTSKMIFGVREQVAALSSRITLFPGDVILTGTPAGTGSAYGQYLQPGDTVRAQVEGLGDLITYVA